MLERFLLYNSTLIIKENWKENTKKKDRRAKPLWKDANAAKLTPRRNLRHLRYQNSIEQDDCVPDRRRRNRKGTLYGYKTRSYWYRYFKRSKSSKANIPSSISWMTLFPRMEQISASIKVNKENRGGGVTCEKSRYRNEEKIESASCIIS